MGVEEFSALQDGTVNPFEFFHKNLNNKKDVVVINGIPAILDGWTYEAVTMSDTGPNPSLFIQVAEVKLMKDPKRKLLIVSKNGASPSDAIVVRAVPSTGNDDDAVELVVMPPSP